MMPAHSRAGVGLIRCGCRDHAHGRAVSECDSQILAPHSAPDSASSKFRYSPHGGLDTELEAEFPPPEARSGRFCNSPWNDMNVASTPYDLGQAGRMSVSATGRGDGETQP